MILTLISALNDENDRRIARDIYDLYSSRMKKYAYSILKNEHDAEDAVQDTMIRIIKNLPKFKACSSEVTEMLVVTYMKNVALSIYQKNKNSRTRYCSYSELEDCLADEDMFDEIVLRDMTDRLRVLIKQLPEECQALLSLHYEFEHSIEEVAGVLDITESYARTKLTRAKQALRKKWREYYGQDS